jgi:hypothetical protein
MAMRAGKRAMKEEEKAVPAFRRIDTRLVMAGLFLAAMMPLAVTPVLPLIDHYNHLVRFYVLAHLDSSPLLQQHYRARWAITPDMGLDILAIPLLRLVQPLVAAHLIIMGVMALLYSGALYFNRALTGQRSVLVAVLMLPLLYSYVLNWGFINFLLGLGIAFWGAGWWLWHRRDLRVCVPVACLFALTVFLTHGAAFVLYGVLLVSLEIGIFFETPERDVRKLAHILGWVAIQAVVPTLLFIWWRLNTVPLPVPEFSGGPPPPLPHNGLYRLKGILRVEEGPAYWFDIATFVLQTVLALILLAHGRLAVARKAWPLIAMSILLVAVMPSNMFSVFYISDRVPLFAALCLLCAVSFATARWTGWSRLACGALVAIVFVRIGAITADWRGYARDYREFKSVAEKIPPGSMTLGVMVGSGHHETGVPRCEMYGPLLVTNYGQIGPTFDDENQHPLVLTGALKRANDSLALNARIPTEMTTDFNPYLTAAAASGYDHLLVCNPGMLTHPFPAGMDVVARTPRFALLRVHPR